MNKLIFFAILFLFALMAQAQDPASGDNTMQFNKTAAPSGSMQFLGANAKLSTNLYTGGLQASLPLYDLKGSDLDIPISLAYTASNGVRVTDPNTDVGMDWVLLAGGSITRVVRGLPDDAPYGYIGTNHEGATVVSDYNSPSETVTQDFNNTYNSLGRGAPVVDGEPDIFIINTPYFTTRFTLDQNGVPVFQNNTGLQIVHSLFNNSTWSSYTGFTVRDAQGTEYIFGSKDSTRETTTTKFFGQSFTFVSTWYLEKVVSLNGKDVVALNYFQGTKADTVYNYELNKSYQANWPAGSVFPYGSYPTSFSNIFIRPALVSTVIYNAPKYVSQIITKLGEADFTYAYSLTTGINQANPPELTTITIKQLNPLSNTNTNVVETFQLGYTDIETGLSGWTVPFPVEYLYSSYLRRLVSSVTATGGSGTPSLQLYALKYYQVPYYPERELLQNCDFWGFANSLVFMPDATDADDPFYTTPQTARMPASCVPTGMSQSIPMAAIFALQEVDVLGGSATQINYQQNDYSSGGANVQAGGARVSSVVRKLPTGESLTTSYVYTDVHGNSTGEIWSNLFGSVTMYFGGGCCTLTGLTFSGSPYGYADDQGVMVGYSEVKVIDPTGGYTISDFTNFADNPDLVITPSSYASATTNGTYGGADVSSQISSFSYKRGLLTNKAVYKANGDMITQDLYLYGSLDNNQPVVKEIGFQDNTWWLQGNPQYVLAIGLPSVNIYHSNIENWRLLEQLHKDYDQKTPANALSTFTIYAYAPDKRNVRSITTTDSKGQTFSKTYYFADDAAIPMVTSAEQSALSLMAAPAVNATNVLVHEVDSRNGAVHQTHNSYAAVASGTATNFYVASTSNYVGTTAVQQTLFNFDAATSLLTSSNIAGGKPTSYAYAYNTAYPVAKIVNAAGTLNHSNQFETNTASVNVPPNYWGSEVASFTTTAAGTITISMPAGSYLGGPGGVTCFFSFSLTGAAIKSGSLCNSSVTGYTCSAPNSISFTNMPAGSYSLTVSAYTNTATSPVPVNYTYPGFMTVTSGYDEFFYEGFEQNTGATSGSAHTGNLFWNGNYTATYIPPDSKQYLIQWWSLVSGKWTFNSQPYVNGMTLSGPVDDVRIFPSDALMTTYTYSPLVGKTSETDPAGHTKTFEYDGLGRLLRIRDQDGNLVKQYDYEYQAGLHQ